MAEAEVGTIGGRGRDRANGRARVSARKACPLGRGEDGLQWQQWIFLLEMSPIIPHRRASSSPPLPQPPPFPTPSCLFSLSTLPHRLLSICASSL
ncbi:hypothetical protein E2562_015499 [Oryza meyeriana var. granulata]|uniref:Uncharacterized protein n=1 Tax=Oryza meyeriana var. granulata TaxID=110450 RepID=A0A6G1CRL2_9ORYZ|nr:hypothetical protein E2562_015499 [Oryza meyeriana var. granulata]